MLPDIHEEKYFHSTYRLNTEILISCLSQSFVCLLLTIWRFAYRYRSLVALILKELFPFLTKILCKKKIVIAIPPTFYMGILCKTLQAV
jgi:hypothetical protein